MALGKLAFSRVQEIRHSAKKLFAECISTALGKHLNFPSAVCDPRQTKQKKNSSALQTFSVVYMPYVVLHVKIWYISRSVCYISLIYYIKRIFGG